MSRTLREVIKVIHEVAAEIGREDGVENSPSMQFIATTSELALRNDHEQALPHVMQPEYGHVRGCLRPEFPTARAALDAIEMQHRILAADAAASGAFIPRDTDEKPSDGMPSPGHADWREEAEWWQRTCEYWRMELKAEEKRGTEGMVAELMAQRFHETYEELAPSFGYETRKDSAVPWDQVPENNRELMIAVCAEVLGKVEKLRQIAQALVDHGRPGYNCPSDTYSDWADEHERLSNEIENELGRRAR